MRTLLDLRQECGNCLSTRALKCPDGITRVVVLHPKQWQELDTLLVVDTPSLAQILRFLLRLSEKTVRYDGWEHETAFRELLMYYIHRNHQSYLEVHHQLANDNRDDCFAHLRDQND